MDPVWQLCRAAEDGDLDTVKQCIAEGVDVNGTYFGATAIYYAYWEGHKDIVDELLQRQDIEVTEYEILYAAGSGDIEKVRSLLAAGVDINKADHRRNTALHWASQCNQLAMLKELMTRDGIDVQIRNKIRNTALDTALWKYNNEIDRTVTQRDREQIKIDWLKTICLLLVSRDIKNKESLDILGKVGVLVCQNSNGDVELTQLSDEKAANEVTSVQNEGKELSVVILNDDNAVSRLNKLFKGQTLKLKSLVLCNVNAKNLEIANVSVSHVLTLSQVKSFPLHTVSHLLSSSVKFFHCVNNDIPMPWHIEVEEGLFDTINISHCTPFHLKKRRGRGCINLRKHRPIVNPSNIFNISCKGVKNLYLQNSGLTHLQDDIGYIGALEVFDASHNLLKEIPHSLVDRNHVYKEFRVEGNPAIHIPPGILSEGIQSVISYLKEFLGPNAHTVPNKTVKIVLVGHEEVGKSTFIQRLIGDWSQEKPVKKTDGIEITKIEDGDLTLIVHDLGGDVDFLESHTLFMTDDCVYVLMFDLSKCVFYKTGNAKKILSTHQLGRLKLWLQNIHSLAPNSPVIIAGTHADVNLLVEGVCKSIWQEVQDLLEEARESHQHYYAKNPHVNCFVCHGPKRCVRKSKCGGLAGYGYIPNDSQVVKTEGSHTNRWNVPHVLGYFEIGSKIPDFPKGNTFKECISNRRQNRSMLQLKKALIEVAKEFTGDKHKYPKKWDKFRKDLGLLRREENDYPVIEYARFQTLAKECGITTKTNTEAKNTEALKNVTSFLCSQGDIVVDKSTLKQPNDQDLVILSPQWLANLLRTFITFKGKPHILTQEDLAKAWKSNTEKHRAKLMGIFVAMDVCIRIKQTQSRDTGGEDRHGRGTDDEDRHGRGTDDEDRHGRGTDDEDRRIGGTDDEDRHGRGTNDEDRHDRGTDDEDRHGRGTDGEDRHGRGTDGKDRHGRGTDDEDRHGRGTNDEDRHGRGTDDEDRRIGGTDDDDRHGRGSDDDGILSGCSYLIPCNLPLGQPSEHVWKEHPGTREQASWCYNFEFLPPMFFCDLIALVYNIVDRNKRAPYCSRNNVVFSHTFSKVTPCGDCDGSESEVHSIGRFELLYHSSSILASVRGKHACCVIVKLREMVDQLQGNKYPSVSMKASKMLCCPYCIYSNMKEIGEVKKETGGVWQCSNQQCHDHIFNSWKELLEWKGVKPRSLEKVLFNFTKDMRCPKFFILLPINSSSQSLFEYFTQSVFSLVRDGYALHFICESPEGKHGLTSSGFRVNKLKEFVEEYGQYVCKVLKYFNTFVKLAPIIPNPAVEGAGLCADLLDEFLQDCNARFPDVVAKIELDKIKYEDVTEENIVDAGLDRGKLANALGIKDGCSTDNFGGLYPIQVGQDWLWLCKEHYAVHEVK